MVFGSFDQFHVEFLAQSSLSLEELLQDLVVHAVRREQLFVGEGALVGHRYRVNFAVLRWVFQLHLSDY